MVVSGATTTGICATNCAPGLITNALNSLAVTSFGQGSALFARGDNLPFRLFWRSR